MSRYLILTLSFTVVLPHFCESSIEADFPKSFLKRQCWLCSVPQCKQCVASQWTQWSHCTSPCGINGYQSRTRLVHRPPSCPEDSCWHLLAKEWQACNRFCHNGGTPSRWYCSCALDHIGDCCETAFSGWSNWGDWGQCNKSCGSGEQERMRVCIGLPKSNSSVCGSACTGPSVESRECNTQECPVQYGSRGCFKDGVPRALPLLVANFRSQIDWTDMKKTVQECAQQVHGSNLTVFGIQFYGECWSGINSTKTYEIYGPSKNCWNGVGKEGSYFVYKIKV